MACPSVDYKSQNIRQSENTLENALIYFENNGTSRRTLLVQWIKLLKSYLAVLNAHAHVRSSQNQELFSILVVRNYIYYVFFIQFVVFFYHLGKTSYNLFLVGALVGPLIYLTNTVRHFLSALSGRRSSTGCKKRWLWDKIMILFISWIFQCGED